MKPIPHFLAALLLAVVAQQSHADDFAAQCADRAALERVYHEHRLGTKQPFEQAMPLALLEQLVRQDQRKEAALKKTYGVAVTPAMLDAEVQRINTTTRAPEMLAELKTALGNDPARFARAMARPILVERLLREKYDNDDALHAPKLRTVEMIRGRLLTARGSQGDEALSEKPETRNPKSEIDPSAGTNGAVERLVAILKNSPAGSFTETTWQLGAHPAETNASATDEIEIRKRFGPNAQILSPPHAGGKEAKFYFEDLPGDLQNVLRVQLRRPGDVSAVIETPGGFLLYLAKEKSDAVLSVAVLSLPKRSYEQWLEESKNQP